MPPIEPSKKYNDLPPEHKQLVEQAIKLSEAVQANMFKNMDTKLLSQMKIDPNNIDHERQRAKQREKYSGFTPDQLHSLISQFEQTVGHMGGNEVSSLAPLKPVNPPAIAGAVQDKNALIADIAEASFQKLIHANPSELSAETREVRKNAVINKAGFIAQMSATYQAYPVEMLAGIARGLHEDKDPLVEQPRSAPSNLEKAKNAADGVPLKDALGNYSTTPKPPADKVSEPAKPIGRKF